MGAVLGSFAGAAHNPVTPKPKCVSLLQQHELLSWFASEPTQTPPAVEGRFVELDSQSRVEYTSPGPQQKSITDISPALASGAARFLLHTNCEHIQAKARDRNSISLDDLIVYRSWQTLLSVNGTADADTATTCQGCGTPCPVRPMFSHLCRTAVLAPTCSANSTSCLNCMQSWATP